MIRSNPDAGKEPECSGERSRFMAGVQLGEEKDRSSSLLPVWFVEPTVSPKRKQLVYARKGKPENKPDMAEVKHTLLDIRADTLEHFTSFEKKLKRNLDNRDNVEFFSAQTGLDAIDHISNILGESSTIAVNNSSTVREIISQLPEDSDLNFFDSYSEAVRWSVGVETKNEVEKDKLRYRYWDLPSHDPVQIWNSFSVEPSTKGYYRSEAPYIPGEYASLLGINCISSDGDLFLLQHLQNMTNILAGSKKAIFIIGLEKLVRTYEQALFQTRCSALYGYETILLDLFSEPGPGTGRKYKEGKVKRRSQKQKGSFIEFGLPQEVHVIILDNGRKELEKTEFRDILKCIGCKACSRLCPRSRWDPKSSMNARDLIMDSFIMGLEHARNSGLFDCTLCRNCQDVCPVDIPLQEYLLKLRKATEREGILPDVHAKIYNNIKNFNTPYGID